MKKQIFTYYYLFILLFVILMSSCAIIKAPSGGPPDTTPPEILHSIPIDGTTNYSENTLKLEFSEYVNKQSVIQNLYFSPTLDYEYSWSDKELKISVNDTLWESLTYILTLGTDYTDLHKNKPTTSFSIAFSTGNLLDSGKIKGILYKPGKQSYIYLYKIRDNYPKINVEKNTPDYKIPIGSSGEFVIKGLKDGNYRIFAINDEFKTSKYDIQTDAFSAYHKDIVVLNGKTGYVRLLNGKIIDNSGVYINSIYAKANNHIQIKLNEPIPIRYFNNNYLSITDSSTNSIQKVLSIYPSPDTLSIIHIILEKKLNTDSTYLCSLNKNITDTLNNSVIDSLSSEYFYVDSTFISPTPKIISFSHIDSLRPYHINIPIEIKFDFPIVEKSLNQSIKIFQVDSINKILLENVIIKTNIENKLIYTITPNVFEENKIYQLEIQSNLIENIFGNFGKDTLISYKFNLINESALSKVNGTLQAEITDKIYIILFQSKTDKYQTEVIDSKWNIDNIKPAAYEITIYIDNNNNNKYDFGEPLPYKFGEPIYISPNPIKIKSGWDTENIILKFPIE